MMVLLAYDVPEQKHQTFLRKEFERLGGTRVQYSLYAFNGETHECERIIRQMQRVVKGIPGDIRLLPMDEGVWDAQIVLSEIEANTQRIKALQEFVVIW